MNSSQRNKPEAASGPGPKIMARSLFTDKKRICWIKGPLLKYPELHPEMFSFQRCCVQDIHGSYPKFAPHWKPTVMILVDTLVA